MSTIANSKNDFLDLSKLGIDELKLLKEFYNFLLFQKEKQAEDKNDVKKIPDIFFHPTKVDIYLAFERT